MGEALYDDRRYRTLQVTVTDLVLFSSLSLLPLFFFLSPSEIGAAYR